MPMYAKFMVTAKHNPWALIVSHLEGELSMTQRAISEELEMIKTRSAGRFQKVATSQASITRHLKKKYYALKSYEKEILSILIENNHAYLEAKNIDELLVLLSSNEDLVNKAEQHVLRSKKQGLKVDWTGLNHIFGIWQTMNLSTYIDAEYQELNGHPNNLIRYGLRLIGPHEDAKQDRKRLRVCDIGPSTKWDGSADVHDDFMYIRLREISGGPHTGERIYSTIKKPSTFNHVANKEQYKYKTMGMTQVMVRASTVAPAHVFSGVSLMRYMQDLSGTYVNDLGEVNFTKFLKDYDVLHKSVCGRVFKDDLIQKAMQAEPCPEHLIGVTELINSIINPQLEIQELSRGSIAVTFKG